MCVDISDPCSRPRVGGTVRAVGTIHRVSLPIFFLCSITAGCLTDNLPEDESGDETSGECRTGELGCECAADGRCDPGLLCDATDVCVEANNTCGDGMLEPGEECDQGASNADDGICKSNCTLQVCGDGFVGPGEGCDDGNEVDEDDCSNSCVPTTCGDGVVQPPEECDDGNSSNEDECTEACAAPACGDGFVQPGQGETCDDGNAESGDGCEPDCTASPLCGDGNSAPGELCLEGVAPVTLTVPSATLSIATAELDGEAGDELVVGAGVDEEVWVYAWGDGSLSKIGEFMTPGNPSEVVVYDYDGDGALDLGVGISGELVLLRNDDVSPLSFTLDSALDTGTTPVRTAVGDFNADGLDDVVTAVSEPTAGDFPCYFTISFSSLEGGTPGPLGSHCGNTAITGLDAGDFLPGDDGMEPVGGNREGELHVFAAEFMIGSPVTTELPGSQVLDVKVSDLNGDEFPDVVVASSPEGCDYQDDPESCGGDEVLVVHGVDESPYLEPQEGSVSLARGVLRLERADMNGDGSDDFVALTTVDPRFKVLVPDGDGGLEDALTVMVNGAQQLRDIALGDYNGDGSMDVAVLSRGTNSVLVYFAEP